MRIRERARVVPFLRQCWSARAAAGRRRLDAADPAVRRLSAEGFPLRGRTVDHYSAAAAATADLRTVTDLLESEGIPYFLVPGHDPLRKVVGVEEQYRREFLRLAGEQLRRTAGYVAALGQSGVPSRVVLWADGRLPRSIRSARALRLGVVRLGPVGQILGGLDTGCEVEFWRQGHELDGAAADAGWLTVPTRQLGEVFSGALVAPRVNRVTEVLPADARKPASITLGGHGFPTFEPFAEPGVDEVLFPIDVVYTWVDGSDPVLAAKREAHRDGTTGLIAAREVGSSRYTSHDELKYSLRSLEMYADFIRHIYIVTDGQKPHWLNEDAEGITVVDHRDILPAEALPVFNSHAIESRLHRIPGLSEHYLYFNDDVFVNRPVEAGRFFHGNGIALLPFSPFKLGVGAPQSEEPAPNSAGKNVREVILRAHGRYITNKFLHTPHPQLLSVMKELHDLGIPELESTTRSRFRSIRDVAPAATLHHHWAMVTGRAVPGEYSFRYVELGKPDLRERLARLANAADVDFFCLNDVSTDDARRDAIRGTAHTFLERRFPFASRFEKTLAKTPVRTGG
ncbi:stealth family protein [Peterkaempfera bronchialis]|uniref:Sugar phosphotransferase n=1 Tax=Peterkaempfera bronchialis TaxID=2126346 RepID=A0A345SWD4_9ACTN|nr:stealth family protein [Peterkaempfera bronchialis]AXI78039.1 hypothetical protein C7M71_011905 [Peterkaempfera bronchialis]